MLEKKIILREIETTKIDQNIRKRHAPDGSIHRSNSVKVDRFKRFERKLASNPIYYGEQPNFHRIMKCDVYKCVNP